MATRKTKKTTAKKVATRRGAKPVARRAKVVKAVKPAVKKAVTERRAVTRVKAKPAPRTKRPVGKTKAVKAVVKAAKKPVRSPLAKAKPVVKKPTVAKAVAKPRVGQKVGPVKASRQTSPKATPVRSASAKKPATHTAPVTRGASKLKTVTFRVTRGEQVNGQFESYLEEFQVPYDETTSVLQGLEWIKAQLDGSLTFRRSCRATICGSCGMFINNRSRLACQTKIKDILAGDPVKNIPPSTTIELRAQNNQPILKDLVVDIREFYGKVDSVKPYVSEGPEKATSVNKQSFEQVNMVSNCIMCGLCYSDCTAMVENPNFIGPAALAKAFRFVSDPREGNKTERLKELSEKNGIWDCTRCGMCVDACPKGVAPMEAIVKLRTRAIEAGVTDNAGARHAMAFKNDIATGGLLNEPMLLVKTLGVGVVNQLGAAVHLAKVGKIPSPLPHKVERVHEVADIFAELKKNPISVETKAEDKGPGAG